MSFDISKFSATQIRNTLHGNFRIGILFTDLMLPIGTAQKLNKLKAETTALHSWKHETEKTFERIICHQKSTVRIREPRHADATTEIQFNTMLFGCVAHQAIVCKMQIPYNNNKNNLKWFCAQNWSAIRPIVSCSQRDHPKNSHHYFKRSRQIVCCFIFYYWNWRLTFTTLSIVFATDFESCCAINCGAKCDGYVRDISAMDLEALRMARIA